MEKRDSQGGRKREKKGIITQHSQLKKPKEEGANENGGGGGPRLNVTGRNRPPGARFSKVPITFRARKAILLAKDLP